VLEEVIKLIAIFTGASIKENNRANPIYFKGLPISWGPWGPAAIYLKRLPTLCNTAFLDL